MKEEKEITLDNWGRTHAPVFLVQSQWRKDRNKDFCNLLPSLSDVEKIQIHLKKNVPEFEIMKAFSMDSKTMHAIIEGRYDPATGIEKEKNYVFKDKIERIEKRITICASAIGHLISLLLTTAQAKEFYRKTKLKKAMKIALPLSENASKKSED